jgi:hypothetical protein
MPYIKKRLQEPATISLICETESLEYKYSVNGFCQELGGRSNGEMLLKRYEVSVIR